MMLSRYPTNEALLGAAPEPGATTAPARRWLARGALLCAAASAALFFAGRSALFMPVDVASLVLTAIALGTNVLMLSRSDRPGAEPRPVVADAVDAMADGLMLFDRDASLVFANGRVAAMVGLPAETMAPGLLLQDFVDQVGDGNGWAAERRLAIVNRLSLRLASPDPDGSEWSMAGGRVLAVETRPAPASRMVVTLRDVTLDREDHAEIAHMAFHDVLTGLPNRRALQDRMDEGFHPKRRFKLLLVDLDRFKAINDTFGHAAGDRLLVAVARRVRDVLPPGTFFARIGGDELAILVYGDAELSLAVASRVIAAIAKPFTVHGMAMSIGCSIGLCCTDDASDVEELVMRSDLALYEAKRIGRGRAFCYRPGMIEEATDRRALEADLRAAVEQEGFYLVYQPIVSLGDGQVTGYEALIRWRHPRLGLIPPSRLIPIAEESGLILPIGRWVLGEACREAASWEDPCAVVVNLSPVELRAPTIVADVTAALAASGLAAERLELEVGEAAFAADAGTLGRALAALRQLGVRVAIDDFGSGSSAFALLRTMPFDRIKIDRSFVGTVEGDRTSLAVLRAVTRMARELGIGVVAEGVETESGLRLLREIGCDAVQGFLIGRPGPLRLQARTDLSGVLYPELAKAS